MPSEAGDTVPLLGNAGFSEGEEHPFGPDLPFDLFNPHTTYSNLAWLRRGEQPGALVDQAGFEGD